MRIVKILFFILMLLSQLNSMPIDKSASKVHQVSLQLMWKHQFEFAGFYMAKHQGFYRDVGLDVELKEFDFDTNIVDDVTSNTSTFGLGYPGIILDKASGKDIVLLGAMLQSSPHVLISLKSSNIKSIEDFKDRTINLLDDAIKTASFKSMLAVNNLSFEEMKKAKYRFNINDLISKKVDLSSVFLSNEPYALKQQNIQYDIWNPKDYGFEFYDDLLYTSSEYLNSNPQVVQSFTEASLKGWQYAYTHIEETIKVILKHYNTQNKTKEALLFEANVLKKLAYSDIENFGQIDAHKIQRILDVYNLQGLLKNKIDLNEFIYENKTNRVLLSAKEQEYLKNNPVIRVHNELNWPPYNFNINGQAKGFSIDYMNLVVSKLGIKAQYHVGPTWAEFLDKIKNEQLDVMLNIRNTPSRQKYIHFTKEYIHATKSIFTNDQNIQTVADLKGKTVAVAKGFFVHEFLKQYFPDINLNIQDNVLNCIIAVVEGQADAVVADYGVTSYLMQENGLLLKHTRVLKDERLNTTMHIGTSLKQPILRDILQKSMNTISDEEMQRLRNKWFTSDIRTKKQESILSSYELEYLKNKKEIRMCIDPAWLPFEGRDTKGNHIGLSADYFLEFKKHLDIEMKVVPTKSWTESLQFAQQKKCDILPLAMQTKEREKYLNFTQVYLKTALVIATKVGIPFVDDFRNLKNKKIGIPKGYAFVEIIKQKYPNINIIEVDNVKQGLQRVLSGELYGYVGTLAGINYQFQKESINELKIAGKFDEYWELGVGVRNDDIVLLEIFDKIIQNIEENTHHRILTKWMNIERETLVDYTLFWNILIVVLIAAVFFIYRQRMLNKLNRDLKQKVDEKTKQLLEMNNILEKKVKHAVHENHEKDLILFEQSKMASMGEMIGNIAHQWRQPLSVISTSATGIKLRKEYGELSIEEEYKTLDSINDAAQFLSKTIDDFRDFLKPHKKFNEFNIKDTYFKTYSLIKSKFKNKEIEIITNIHDVEIVGLENELMQVMMNLLNNAYDALDKQTADQRMMWIDLYIYNKQAIFEVKDNAGGIESSILHKVFEPYFTTKHQSQGTGIGLYMTQEIIVKHMNGTIEVSNEKFEYKSKQYNGANFKVSIPLEQLNIQ